MSVGAARSDTGIAGDDTGPDSREWEEDADDGGSLRTELGDFVVELKGREDGWGKVSVDVLRVNHETYLE